jgi:hypothetical protein
MEEQIKNAEDYTVKNDNLITLSIGKSYVPDWDKIQNIEDLKLLFKGINLVFYEPKEEIKHLLKEDAI